MKCFISSSRWRIILAGVIMALLLPALLVPKTGRRHFTHLKSPRPKYVLQDPGINRVGGSDNDLGIISQEPSISNDGKSIAFISNAGPARALHLWTVNRDGTNLRPITSSSDGIDRQPDWSPDSMRIVFASSRQSDNLNVWMVKADGTNPLQLTAMNGYNGQPRYSPNGSMIAFISDRTGRNELWKMNVDGSNEQQLTNLSVQINDPAWSPDGTQLVFSACNNICNLYRLALQGGAIQQITSGSFQDWNPDWGQQGIIFASNRGNSQGLWFIQPDGSKMQAVTSQDSVADVEPRWDRFAGKIVFTRTGATDESTSDIWTTDLGGNAQRLTRLQAADINLDGRVDCADIAIVKASFGKRTGQIGFGPRADVNLDGIVDIRDLAFVSQKLPAGTKCP